MQTSNSAAAAQQGHLPDVTHFLSVGSRGTTTAFVLMAVGVACGGIVGTDEALVADSGTGGIGGVAPDAGDSSDASDGFGGNSYSNTGGASLSGGAGGTGGASAGGGSAGDGGDARSGGSAGSSPVAGGGGQTPIAGTAGGLPTAGNAGGPPWAGQAGMAGSAGRRDGGAQGGFAGMAGAGGFAGIMFAGGSAGMAGVGGGPTGVGGSSGLGGSPLGVGGSPGLGGSPLGVGGDPFGVGGSPDSGGTAGADTLNAEADAISTDGLILRVAMILSNDSADEIDTRFITIRYWFSVDGHEAFDFAFVCVYSDVPPASCTNVDRQSVPYATDDTSADAYVEISFVGGSGILYPTDQALIDFVLYASDFSEFDATNDYSYTTTLAQPWDTVTLYVDGELVWGTPPG